MPDKIDSPEIPMAGGVTSSSRIPKLHLLTTAALVRMAERCELGIQRKGESKAWNATSNNQSCLTDREMALERCGHVILHALKLRDKLVKQTPMEGDDDAAAIAWNGMFLCEATAAMSKVKDFK